MDRRLRPRSAHGSPPFGLAFGPIAIRPFRIVVDDVVFGLIPIGYSEAGSDWERAELFPESLSFAPPWDGIYDT